MTAESPRATVVVPTHDHGPTLVASLGSVLAQDLDDFELFVVGDGCPDVTRDLMADLTATDDRIRWFDNPKGERLGEVHRHAALADANGRFVAYLCDDDLWHRNHLSTLDALLYDADFVHTLPLAVNPDGGLFSWTLDLSLDSDRKLILELENRIPLSFVGHTMDFYRRLPRGWHPGPTDIPSDLYFFRECLAVDDCRAVSGMRATAVHFPSPDRREWTLEQRADELETWDARARSDWHSVVEEILSVVARDRALLESRYRKGLARLRDELYRMSSYVAHARGAVVQADARAAAAAQKSDAAHAELQRAQRVLGVKITQDPA